MRIKDFIALRPPQTLAAQVASLPYDVVNTEEARRLAQGNPHCFHHINRSEIDLPEGTDLYADAVYEKALANFKRFQQEGVLVRDTQPACYVYQLTMGQHTQTGLVTVCHAEDYEKDIIKKHEKTRKAPEDDRTRHTATLNANIGPVFLAYRDQPDIDRLVAKVKTSPALYDFTSADGIRHVIWRVPDGTAFRALFDQVPCAYIADGHHRAASGARVAQMKRSANPAHRGDEEYNWFLAVLFPAGQLKILPYNRCVADLNGMTPDQFLAKMKSMFTVTEAAAPQPKAPGSFSFYLKGTWYGATWKPDPQADPVAQLDVSVLQNRVLGPLLGIDDPRTSKRIEFIGGIRGTDELKRRVDSGTAAVAFSMYPTTIEQLMAIADRAQIMPPKSTWFEPKLRSGLLIHPLD